MRYTKKLTLFASAIVLGLAFMAADASAQIRVGVNLGGGYYRPHYVRRYYAPVYPVYGYYGNPYWNNGRSERYYDKQSFRTAKHRLNKDEEKYYSDGYVTPKEQEKLSSDYYKLNRDRRRLHNDW